MSLEQTTLVKTVLAERVKVLAYLVSLVRQRELAEDIFQDVCVLALQKQEEIADREHLLGWMRVTARMMAMNALRKKGGKALPLSEGVLAMLDGEWGKLDETASSTMLEALEACLKELTEKARGLLRERYGEGLSMGEIARRLNRPVGSVWVTLSRAHKALSDCVFMKVAMERRGANG